MCNIIGINVLYFIHSIIRYSGCRNFSCKKSSFSLSSHGKQTYSNFTFKQLKKVIFLCKRQHKFWNNLIKFGRKFKNLSYSCKFQDFETQGVFNGAECISTIKDTIQTLLQLKFLKKKPFQQKKNNHSNKIIIKIVITSVNNVYYLLTLSTRCLQISSCLCHSS